MINISLLFILFFSCGSCLIQSMEHKPVKKITRQRKECILGLINGVIARNNLDEIERNLLNCENYQERCVRLQDKNFQATLIARLLETKYKLSPSVGLEIIEIQEQEQEEGLLEESVSASVLPEQKPTQLSIEIPSSDSEDDSSSHKKNLVKNEDSDPSFKNTSKWCTIS